MNTPGLSTDYPKWLFKQGDRDVLVKHAGEEDYYRERGYSHEVPPAVPAAVAATNTLDPDRAQPGTVTTAVLDATVQGALDSQRKRFDASWAELSDAHAALKTEHETTKKALAQLQIDHEAALAKIKDLSTPAENAKPVKPPVAEKK